MSHLVELYRKETGNLDPEHGGAYKPLYVQWLETLVEKLTSTNIEMVQSLCDTCFVVNCNRTLVEPTVIKCDSYSSLRSGTKPVS